MTDSAIERAERAVARDPLDVLRNVFGFDSFRGEQGEVVDHLMAGGDALVLMPTGGGKSLCFQIPALCRPGIGIVVSPLIALMQDQVEALRQIGVRAAAMNSTLSFGEMVQLERQMRAGELDIVYAAPERLLSPGFLDVLDNCRLALFAIDEAHCVSQWGHDFRPEYRGLATLRTRFPDVPLVALTATADAPTRADIAQQLGLDGARVFLASFDRPNIRYRVAPKANARQQLLDFLKTEHRQDAGIVYCLSRRKVDETAIWLAEQGFNALPYHAGLDKSVRARHLDRFLKEEAVVMVATIAFGMGIDKPDVRFVAHIDLPKSIEAYYQETGRAGRDGLPSDAWMVYGLNDVVRLRQMIEQSESPDRQKHVERQKLDALLGYCETTRCRRQLLLDYFHEASKPCGNCDTCLEPVAAFDGTEVARKVLSCVYRTGERFGAGHVVDVLLGTDNERMRSLGHDQLTTFGIGKELGRDAWRSIVRQLVSLGLLEVDTEGHGGLRMGADCRAVLRGERRIELRQPVEKAKGTRGKAGRATAAALLDNSDDEALFQALRACRLSVAKTQGVPPYVIFHDSTLLAMARSRPQSRFDMAQVPGVGAAKLARYGDTFLAVIGGETGRA